jgi:Mg-chelatase subunit ChlD
VTFENPQFLALLLLLPVMLLIWVWRGMRTVPVALIARLLVVALIVVAVAHPTQGQRLQASGPLVVLVDQSDSLTAEGQAALRAEAEQLIQTIRAETDSSDQNIALLWFGANTVAPGTWGGAQETDELPDDLLMSLDPSASDLAGALRTARSLLAPALHGDVEQTGHIVLLSDGSQTVGDALTETQLAAEEGVQIDVLPVDSFLQRPELRITRLDAPRSLHIGEEYDVQIVVSSTAPEGQSSATQATLRLWDNEELLAEEAVTLEAGDNLFTFDNLAVDPGVVRLQAEIVGEPDTFARNNSAGMTALVAPRPRVLLVEGRSGNAGDLASALWNAGVDSEVIAADMMPTRLSRLEGFDGMVLVDVPAHNLTLDQMTTVQEFVRSEGRGLVTMGGTTSYGLGAYENTPLEDVLPLDMESPPRPDRTEVALLLIIDRSASMDTALTVSKFDMAKEAAILSVESLKPEDTIGVLAFDTGQEWAVPFQRIGDGIGLQGIKDSIATLPTGGGTDIFRALAIGINDLSRQPMDVRHVVLLTDGRSFTDDRAAYQQLAESALNQEITISTIAIGFDSDTELLDNIAQWGGGRYYFADDPEDIPRLTLQESEIARSDPGVEGNFNATLQEPHPLMRDFSEAELPQLGGYVATTPKDAAEIVLVSPEGDPVLASWQYGLGRAVAWTSSAGEPWASGWAGWEDYGSFWAQSVRYTLPDVNSGPLQVRLTPQHGGARLVADAIGENGRPLDLATAVAQITLPDGTERAINLRQVEPGRYAQDLLLPTDGPYGVAVTLERNGRQFHTEVGYVQEVPDEYDPVAPESSERLRGAALLREIASISGGEVLDSDMALDVADDSDERDDAQAATDNPLENLWMWLLGAALLLWVLEIAIRRGLLVKG